MTSFEATISHAVRNMTLAAINSNMYTTNFPDRAEKGAQDTRFYADWLNRNGRKVEVVFSGSRVDRLSVDGKVLVNGGCLAR